MGTQTAPCDRDLRAALARRTGTDERDWYTVFQARYGMLAVFRALRDARGEGEVVTQLYTCCTAVTPILAAGLVPAYADISPRSAEVDPDRLELTDRTRAVVLQHTYGAFDPKGDADLAALAHAAGLPVLEDCAHCVGRIARDEAGRPLADVSFHSFGVEKMVDGTHFGGAVWVNPESPFAGELDRARKSLEELPAPPRGLALRARAYRVENGVLAHVPAGTSSRLRHGLIAAGLLEPAVSDAELAGELPHAPVKADEWVCARALEGMGRLDQIERRRVETVIAYRSELAGLPGLDFLPAAMEGDAQPLLRFPVFAADEPTADRVLAAVRGQGYYAQAWYRPELGPGVTDPDAYRVPRDRSHLAVHDSLRSRVVALPADVGREAVRHIAEAIRLVTS